MSTITMPTVYIKSACKTANPGSSLKKIPRPPNSFLIYRKEHAKAYKGLVATELSTKLAEAWNNETGECRAHYARLAEKAKKEHAIRYPNYKFTPIKRGTGKRALALAAMANTTTKKPVNDTVSTTRSIPINNNTEALSSSRFSSTPYTPSMADSSNETSCRPRRDVQKSHRFATTAPYLYITSDSSSSKHTLPIFSSPEESGAVDTNSPSLFFNPFATAQWNQPQLIATQ
ncbi:hypothetical protein BGZ65_011230, partial [Modicella reniformis]